MVSRIPIASCIIHPEVKARVDKLDAQRLFLVAHNTNATVHDAVLVDDDRPVGVSLYCARFGSFDSWYSVHCIQISIFCFIDILFQGVAQFVSDESSESWEV